MISPFKKIKQFIKRKLAEFIYPEIQKISGEKHYKLEIKRLEAWENDK